jgi:hypothetical protein
LVRFSGDEWSELSLRFATPDIRLLLLLNARRYPNRVRTFLLKSRSRDRPAGPLRIPFRIHSFLEFCLELPIWLARLLLELRLGSLAEGTNG